MKNLYVEIMKLELSNEVRNGLMQSSKPAKIEKWMKKIPSDQLDILEKIFKKELNRLNKLCKSWGTVKLLNYVGICKAYLQQIEEARI